jgi:two-component system LytT family response regulator
MKTETHIPDSVRVLIVDDEERARDLLEILLTRIPGVEVCGKAGSTDDALDMVIACVPDLVFLDVQMPEKNGFQLVDYFRKYLLNTTVVFVTAHAEFAISALKVSAFDYLLKPVIMEQLNETILRFRVEKLHRLQERKVDRLLELSDKPNNLKFNTRTGYILVKPGEIFYCEADVNYTTLYLGNNNKEVVTVNLGKVEELLLPHSFFRISRSVLVNTAFLKKADRQKKKCLLVKNDEKIWLDIPPGNIRELEKLIDNS